MKSLKSRKMIDRTFETKKELFDYLVKNQDRLIAQKKAQMKKADAVMYGAVPFIKGGLAEKANKPVTEDLDELKVKIVINTTNLMDTHDDVHIPGLWKKSLKENKNIWHDQEHEHKFASTIADYEDLKAYTETMTWKDLGQKWEGQSEALIFESTVKRSRNSFMFDQYKAGYIRNHSVGMHYVKLQMAINDKSYPAEYKAWNDYIDQVANREDAEKQGFFWAVTEAKIVEGSAVKQGANWATPTLENNMKSEPPEGTPEPLKSTRLTSDEIIQQINKHFNN